MNLDTLLHWIDLGVQAGAYIVAAASVVTYATPVPQEGSRLATLRKLLDLLALIPKPRR